MQLLYREYQVPILAPNDIAIINGEMAELAGVEIEDESKVFKYLGHSFLINDSAAKIKN